MVEKNKMNSEELKELEELDTTNIIEDAMYEIWLLSWADDESTGGTFTNFEYKIDEFDSLAEAKKCMNFFSEVENLNLIQNKDPEFRLPEVKELSIELDSIQGDASLTLFENILKLN